MRETINYYYNLNPTKIKKIFDYYYFYLNNELFYFVIYNRRLEDVNSIYEFNQSMIKHNILVNEIINNKNGTVITYFNKVPYILMKVLININKPILLSEISYISNVRISYSNNLMRSNWAILWEKKIDYLEYHHEQNYQKYPLLSDSFDYFVGMAENAISYLNSVSLELQPDKSDIGVISHDIITKSDSVYALYNPLNIIIDHKARDLAEYIKMAFFKDNFSIFDELDEYFKYNYFSIYGISLLIARILYPSFYFEIYDEVVNNNIQESVILKITSRTSEYEIFLADIFAYFHKYYDIKDINWIKKRAVNLP